MIRQNHRRAKTIWLALLLIAGFYGLISCPDYLLGLHQHAEIPETVHAPSKTIYKTIISSDQGNSLLGFELHKDVCYARAFGNYTECSVIVRNLDPQKDDYKAYCKDIVNDLVDAYGSERIRIHIFDSFEAYTLTLNDRFLVPEEESMLSSHTVAVFDSFPVCSDDDERTAFLTFYPDAGNGLTERVAYTAVANRFPAYH